jgi:aspartyl-tRNA(Asn)/glutamyl-tRNA(Gln) amidotransferase subunit B
MSYEAVIGLEIHAQLPTETKIFCGCSTRFGAPPNTQVCPVCIGLPGVLPVLNRQAVEYAVTAALALGCTIQPSSVFARKNYFYPDLPKGYQISQYELPLATEGRLEPDINGPRYPVRIIRVHLEEDAGKSLHEGFTDSDRKTYVDFNRSGVPLIEIVTYPDLRSAADAAESFGRLRELLMAIGVNDGNMEEGSLRCDANVSVRPTGSDRLGTKAEVKNVNSFRFVQKALEYEISRQTGILERGAAVRHETRLFDAATGRTIAMRSKEEAHDYRYFPEPDLPPLQIDAARIDRLRSGIPELPAARRRRFVADYGLSDYDAVALTQVTPGLDRYFEATSVAAGNAKSAANWALGAVRGKMNELGTDRVADIGDRLPPDELGSLIRLVEEGVISGSIAKEVFEKMFASGRPAAEIVKADGLAQIGDEAALLAIVKETIANNPGPVAHYRAGRTTTFGFLVGQVMKATKGKANPRLVNDLLRREIDKGA